MPRMPGIETQSLVPNYSTSLGAPSADGVVGAIGSAVGMVGRTVERQQAIRQREKERADEELRQLQRRRQADEDAVSVINAESRVSMRATERMAAAESDPNGMPGFTAKILKEVDGWIAEEAQGASESAKPNLAKQMAHLRARVNGQAFIAETKARHGKLVTDFAEGLDTDRRLVTADPRLFNEALARRTALAGSLDVPAAVRSKMIEHARESLASDAAASLVERDPEGMAAAMSDSEAMTRHPVLRQIAPERIAQLRSRAGVLLAQREAKAEHALDKRLRVAEKQIGDARELALSGVPFDPGYQGQLLADTAGTPYAEGARALIDQANAGAGFGAQTIGRQRQTLRNLEAQVSAGGTSPEGAKVLQRARTIHDNQVREYKENPWAAGTRFGRLPAVPDTPLPSADLVPQYISQVLPLMDAVETAADGAISPLQPAQATKFAAQLEALPPEQRGEVLGLTGQQLTPPRIKALADQLDKADRSLNLALKLGSDRTTAGRTVSALVLRGAQALKDKEVKRDDAALTGWRSEISTMVRGTLGDAQAEQEAIDAAYYVRAAMDAQGAVAPGFDRIGGVSNASAVAMVLGAPLERGGVKTVLPRGMTERDFDAKLRDMTPDKLRELAPAGEVYVRGTPMRVEALSFGLTGYGMRRDGAGRYIPVRGNAFVTLDKEGTQPLRLEMR